MRFFHKKPRRAIIAVIISVVLVLIIYLTFFNRKRNPVYYEKPPPPRLYGRCFNSDQSQNINFTDDTIINPRFSYPINIEDACVKDHVEVIMPIHSSITNFRRRNITRHSTHGYFASNRWNRAKIVFFVGIPSNKLEKPEKWQEDLEKESNQYQDIVQINVNETYRNIVFKAIAVLQWVDTYCNNTDFVLKMDDDVLADPAVLLLPLYKYRNFYTEFILGELRTNRIPERNKEIKWHMPFEQYPNSSFPPFVPGPVIGYPTSTARLLYQQALRTTPIWLDDVFITGICSQMLGIPVFHDDNFNHVHSPLETENFIYE